MKNYARRIFKLLIAFIVAYLLVLSSACTQAKISPNPNLYTGVYQYESDPTSYLTVFERDGRILARSEYAFVELKMNAEHSFEFKEWGLTGKFSNLEDSKFQSYVEKVDEKQSQYNRIEAEPTLAFLYDGNAKFTDLSSKSNSRCSDDYPLHALADNSKHPGKIEKLVKKLTLDRFGLQKQDSLLIFKDNKLLVEEYFKFWTRNDPHQVESISKSITSLLVGSLITEGKLADVNTPIATLLPEYAHLLTGKKSKITLANFLNMSAGLEWDEWSVPYTDPSNIRILEAESDDSVAFTLQRSMTNKPGEHFSYSGGYVSVVGSVIAAVTTLPTAADYAITSALEELCLKNSFWSKQKDGITNTAGGLRMRPIDMLKVGQLMLNEGMWQDKRVIDRQWILDSMDPASNPYNDTYGYFWWHKEYEVGGKTYKAVLASGWGGQEIVIVKALNLVVVKTATNFAGRPKISEMMSSYILPAFVE